MKRTKSQFNRILELDRQIRSGKYPNCLTFAAEWEVTQKTIQRDIDFLRDQQGAPVAYDRVKKGFYYTDTSWMLPSLVMSEGELVALLLAARSLDQYRGMPIGREVDTLLRKLAELLPDKINLDPAQFYGRFTFRSPPARTIDPQIFQKVLKGLTTCHTLKMRYRPFEVDLSKVLKDSYVQPYHLANLQGEWYVFGVHKGHSDIRQFALARIAKAEVTAESFVIPPEFSPDKMLEGVFGRYTGQGDEKTQLVQLLFSKEIAQWITEREWHPDQIIKRRKSGDVELHLPIKGLFEVQRWVLSWGHWVRVLGPAELCRMMGVEIRMMKNIKLPLKEIKR